ncbi:MAG: hypothetical protein AB7D06_17290 [Pedobacter sp.]
MAIIKCSACGKNHSDKMPDCPFCHASPNVQLTDESHPGVVPAPAKKGLWQKHRVTVLAICIIGIVAAQIYSTTAMNRIDGSPAENKKIHPSTAMAYIISQNFVKASLKSPATAEFPLQPDFTQQLSNKKFRIGSHVDSQNSFGALIRSRFYCDLSIDDAGEWHIDDLQFIEY